METQSPSRPATEVIRTDVQPVIETKLGRLYRADCLDLFPKVDDRSIDLIFADPPFNLRKAYDGDVNDNRSPEEYLSWSEDWIAHCARVLKPGGSIFIYNLPVWAAAYTGMLTNLGLSFRHWIAIEQTTSTPVTGRLYPAHYALLYYSKGRPSRFRRIMTPVATCRHCGQELKDYGGYKERVRQVGTNLKDVWTDITPVRHQAFKPRSRRENALSTKILERVIEIASRPMDIVLDPFGGSGTTFAVCEQRRRQWIGFEKGPTEAAAERLNGLVCNHTNSDRAGTLTFDNH